MEPKLAKERHVRHHLFGGTGQIELEMVAVNYMAGYLRDQKLRLAESPLEKATKDDPEIF